MKFLHDSLPGYMFINKIQEEGEEYAFVGFWFGSLHHE